ncbi:MAG: Beta-1,3-glucuronyltransferase 2 (Glucuronosyltransferase S) [Cyphobasidiales sp. Tagirdzhanova-0007]|nr:MAG: Beta-1,3-glucuronyltransferase 2 (Glucuronosyltransferase S) [Cyphobasidiales sp. Tagirdzhanova-0007]
MYGRLGDIPTRLRYFKRHADTISQFLRHVKNEGYRDGAMYTDRQLIWLIAEDGDAIDPATLKLLRDTGLPFIYFAHGPTRSYGLAQWNVLLSTIEFVRDNFLGDGPVLSVDDDARIDPELLRRIWQVKRAILWQVGNLRDAEYESTREGPVLENGTVVRWHVSWNPKRIFPIDMLGFAINSSMIGPGKPLHGQNMDVIPQAWHVPDKRISAPLDTAPESEFLEKIYSSRECIEYLCRDTVAEQCFYAWHNDWF